MMHGCRELVAILTPRDRFAASARRCHETTGTSPASRKRVRDCFESEESSMHKRTGLWLMAATFALAGCSSGANEPAPAPIAGSTQSELVAGTTFNGTGDAKTTSPIKHVIVIVGENRTFDHVFATYQPQKGQTVANLLSKGIIHADGTPGPNFAALRAIQRDRLQSCAGPASPQQSAADDLRGRHRATSPRTTSCRSPVWAARRHRSSPPSPRPPRWRTASSRRTKSC